MTPKILLDSLRSDWIERRSKELVNATSQNTEEEDKAQLASGSCDALTAALRDLSQLPDREFPTIGTFETLRHLISSRLIRAEEKQLNLTPTDHEFVSMETLGMIEEYRRILQDIYKNRTLSIARDEKRKNTQNG